MPHINNFGLVQDIASAHISNALRNVGVELINDTKTIEYNKENVRNTFKNLIRILKNEFSSDENFFMAIFKDRNQEIIKQYISTIFDNYIEKGVRKALGNY